MAGLNAFRKLNEIFLAKFFLLKAPLQNILGKKKK